jgi:hypothetical protein
VSIYAGLSLGRVSATSFSGVWKLLACLEVRDYHIYSRTKYISFANSFAQQLILTQIQTLGVD